jgi:hypothetical protein
VDTRQNGGAEAEMLLLAAVLARAVRDLIFYSRGKTPEERRIAAEALEWLFEPSPDTRSITSFRGICQALNLDHGRVRDQIVDMLPERARSLHPDGGRTRQQPPGGDGAHHVQEKKPALQVQRRKRGGSDQPETTERTRLRG